MWFLDDGTLAGPRDTVAADLRLLFPVLRSIGLEVNWGKCEISHMDRREEQADSSAAESGGSQPSHADDRARDAPGRATPRSQEDLADQFLNGARLVTPRDLSLLGVPIHEDNSGETLSAIETITRTLIHRTGLLDSHMALFFLSRYASVPRATYLMRAAPVFTAGDKLRAIDELQRDATSSSCNVVLEDGAWTQATLPLRLGGLGIRRMADVALPAFISSMDATRGLVCTINHRPDGDRPTRLASAVDEFTASQVPDLTAEEPLDQRHLDELASRRRLDNLLHDANQVDRARLLAASAPHSGAWLSALPVEKLGLLLPDEAVRTGVALRLGAPVQQPHRCRCGAMSDKLGHHNLSCRRDPGRLPRHAALNDVLHRALASAGVVAVLEPRGLDRGDGRRPDGITVYPFRRGKMLAWDATCVSTYSGSHLLDCAISAGAAARAAEDRKRQRYAALRQRYDFVPLAIETTGVLGPAFSDLLQDIGRRISQRSGEKRETAWLRQRISLAVIRGNAAALCQL